MYKSWIDVLTKPKVAFEKEEKRFKSKEDMTRAALFNYGIVLLIVSIYETIIGLANYLPEEYLTGFFGDLIPAINSMFFITLIFIVLVSYMYFKAIKLFKGKGDFSTYFYINSIYFVPVVAVYWIISLFTRGNYDLALILGWVMLAVLLYGVYLFVLALKSVSGFSFKKSVGITLLGIIPALFVLTVMNGLVATLLYF